MSAQSFSQLAKRAKLSWSPQVTEEYRAAAEFYRAQTFQFIYESTYRMERR